MGSIISTPINTENLQQSLKPIYDDITTKADKIKVFDDVFMSVNGVVELTDAILPIQDIEDKNTVLLESLNTNITDLALVIDTLKDITAQVALLKQTLFTLDNLTLGHTVWRYLSYDALIAQEAFGYFAGYIFDNNMSMGVRKEFLRAEFEQLLNSGALIVENGANADTFYLPLKENEFIRHVGSLAQYGTHQEDATQKWWASFGNMMMHHNYVTMKDNVSGVAKSINSPWIDPDGKRYKSVISNYFKTAGWVDSSGIIIEPSTKVRMNDNETTVKNMAWILLYKLKPNSKLKEVNYATSN